MATASEIAAKLKTAIYDGNGVRSFTTSDGKSFTYNSLVEMQDAYVFWSAEAAREAGTRSRWVRGVPRG